ncbi:MAG: hypothetical protein M3072_13820 [Candidatus Dormibacteraeota bacterium]|nr:hypothetical protein [Candidatus Dormibacteraeota bacterium]
MDASKASAADQPAEPNASARKAAPEQPARSLSADALQQAAGDSPAVAGDAPGEADKQAEGHDSLHEGDPNPGALRVAEAYPADLSPTTASGKANRSTTADTTSDQASHTRAESRKAAAEVSETLREKAEGAERTVTPNLEAIAASTGGKLEGLEHRLKEVDSLTDKVDRTMRAEGVSAEQAGDRVPDSLRYTMTYSNETHSEAVDSALGKLRDGGYQVGDIKNYWMEGNAYKGINVNMTDPQGQAFELQFHTPESYESKMESHDLYEIERDPDQPRGARAEAHATMVERSSVLTRPPDVEEIGRLVRR